MSILVEMLIVQCGILTNRRAQRLFTISCYNLCTYNGFDNINENKQIIYNDALFGSFGLGFTIKIDAI